MALGPDDLYNRLSNATPLSPRNYECGGGPLQCGPGCEGQVGSGSVPGTSEPVLGKRRPLSFGATVTIIVLSLISFWVVVGALIVHAVN
jgi:hypothetical protein